MTDKDYEYYKQNDFRGGICTQAEDAKSNQVLDALNVWTPFSYLEVRPGTTSRIIGDPFAGPSTNLSSSEDLYSASISKVYKITTAGVTTEIVPSGNVYDVSSFPVGTRVVLALDAGISLRKDSAFALAISLNAVNSNNSTFLMEILTDRGYMPLHTYSDPRYLFQAQADPIGGNGDWQYIWFSAPQDTITDLASAGLSGLTSGTGAIVRLAVTSAATDATTKINGGSLGTTMWFRNFSAIQSALNGVFRLQFSNTTKIFTVSTTDYSVAGGNVGTQVVVPPFVTYGMLNAIGFVPQLTPALGQFNFNTAPPNYPFTFRFTNQFRAKTPTVAVIPQIGYAFCAYQNVITQHYIDPTFARPDYDPPITPVSSQAYFGPSTTNPYGGASISPTSGPNNQAAYAAAIIAPVNSDPSLVGPTNTTNGTIGLWPRDTIPQLAAFPAANIVVYHSNTLFALDIADDPQAIRWTTDVNSGGWNIWPQTSVAYLSTPEDNSGITGAAAMGDNLVIFKANSIWVLIPNGTDENNLVNYEARRVVTGVGTASHQSIQAIPQGLIFLGEDGFYIFDGTPNIKPISRDIQALINKITPSGQSLANAAVWRTKQYYFCAVQVHDIAATDDVNTPQNNAVFAYNYMTGAWDYWTGWNVTCWLQKNGLGNIENLWYFDRRGRGYQIGIGSTDDGAQIERMILTNRFGINDVNSGTAGEVRVVGINNNGTVTASLIYEDIEDFVEKSIEMPLTGSLETKYADNPVYNIATYTPERRRGRTKNTPKVAGKWLQIRLKNFNKLFRLALGVHDEGNRP